MYISSLSVGKTAFLEVHFLSLHSCFGAIFHGFITASLVRTQQPIFRGSLGVQGLDITLAQRAIIGLSRGFLAALRVVKYIDVLPLFALCSIAFLNGRNGAFSPLSFNSACLLSVCSKQSIFLIIPPFSLNLVENAASTNLCKKAIPCVMYKVAKPRLRDRSLQV